MARFVRCGAIAPVFAVLCASGCSVLGAFGGGEPSPGTFIAALGPPNGQGEAAGEAEFRFDGIRVDYAIRVSGISQLIGAHIHHGDTRLVIIPFPIGEHVEDSTDARIEGSFAAEDVSISSPVGFNELMDLMRTGDAYVNVHTEAHPASAVRGAIRATPPDGSEGSDTLRIVRE